MNAPTTQHAAAAFSWLTYLPAHWPQEADILHWCQNLGPLAAIGLIAVGIVYLVFGWSMYRVLISVNAAAIGGAAGAMIGQSLGSLPAGLVLGAFVAGVMTWPLMKYAVAVFGGLFGAFVGASLWQTAGLDPRYMIAGAAIGLIFLAMLSFIIFRTSVILFTSLQGSAMVVGGLLGLLSQYPDIMPKLTEVILNKPYFLPMVIFIATVIGHLYQHTRHHAGKPAED